MGIVEKSNHLGRAALFFGNIRLQSENTVLIRQSKQHVRLPEAQPFFIHFPKAWPCWIHTAQLPAQPALCGNRTSKSAFQAIHSRRKEHNLVYLREFNASQAEIQVKQSFSVVA